MKLTWALPRVSAYERLNVVDGSAVHSDYFGSLEVLGDLSWIDLERFITPHEEANIRWYLRQRCAGHRIDRFTLYHGRVRHHLTGGNVHSHHHEDWAFASIVTGKDQSLLLPLRRLSELTSELSEGEHFTNQNSTQPPATIWTRLGQKLCWTTTPSCSQQDELFLDGQNLRFITHELDHMQNLTKLWLSRNQLDNTSLPDTFSQLQSLTFLCLTTNNFTALPVQTLACLPNLTHLLVDHNPITDVSGIERMQRLIWLDLNSCRLQAISGVQLISSLEHLEIHGNDILELPEKVGDLAQLRFLSAHDNKLTALPDSFVLLERLTWLSLNSNRIVKLPEGIGKLRNLERLSLHHNKLTDIPQSMGHLSKLEALSLFGNKLESIPLGLCSGLQACAKLSLQCNSLAALPDDIDRMENLTDLWLYSNRLGQLPCTIGGLRRLERLWIDSNPIRSLPSSIRHCSHLMHIYATDTEIVPDEADLPVECTVIKE